MIFCVLSRSVVSNSFVTPWTPPHQAPLSMGILQAKILEWVAMHPSRGSSQGTEPRSPELQVDSLPSQPPRKFKKMILPKVIMILTNLISELNKATHF